MDVPEIFTFLALIVTELPSEANKIDFKFTVLPLGLYTSSDDNSLLFAPQPWMIVNSVKFAADSLRVIAPAPPDVLAYKTLRDIENHDSPTAKNSSSAEVELKLANVMSPTSLFPVTFESNFSSCLFFDVTNPTPLEKVRGSVSLKFKTPLL